MTEADTKQEAKKVPAWRRKKVGCCIVLGCIILIIVIAVVISVATKHKKHAVGGEFSKDFTVSWAPNHTRLSNHGRRLELFLDPESGKQSSSCVSCKMLRNLDCGCWNLNHITLRFD